jgi:catechol 2,3-dioxygenase-like lactoylglutathione lyase family enzyme
VFDHVTIRVANLAAAAAFYDTVLARLGHPTSHRAEDFVEWKDFSVALATPERPPTSGLHIGFTAPSRAHVDAFWRAGIMSGHPDDGEPGPRPQYREDYYGGFLRDPDGNSAEAVHHAALRRDANIDHLWIRVADLEASAGFYETIAPHAGLRRGDDAPGRRQFRGSGGSFSLVADGAPRTERVHLAFPGDEDAVRAFHRTATGAGYRDEGGPGERAERHQGYYAAYVLDPDGNTVEVVDHRR